MRPRPKESIRAIVGPNLVMRVSCPQCGAEYEFDAAAIPAEGYDAQCTHCSAVFFVAPERSEAVNAVAPPEPAGVASTPQLDPNRVLTIGCPSCGAQYQFPARDIPAGGYEAQCTQCQSIFFVSDESGDDAVSTPAFEGAAYADNIPTDPSQSALTDPHVAIADLEPDESAYEQDSGGRNTDQATLKVRLRDDERLALQDPPTDVPELDSSDLEALPEAEANLLEEVFETAETSIAVPEPPTPEAVEVGAPVRRQTAPLPVMPAPLSTDTESSDVLDTVDDQLDDFESPKSFRVAWIGLGLATALLIAVGAVILLDDGENPEIAASFAEGRKAMMSDTDEGYRLAAERFANALELRPTYAEARALLGLAKVMRGSNTQESARFLVERGKKHQARLASGGGSEEDNQALVKQIAELSGRVSPLLERGRSDIDEGFAALSAALSEEGNNPAVLDAVSVYYSISPDALAKSRAILERAMTIRGTELSEVDWSEPPSLWAGLAMSRIRQGLERKPEEALRILRALLNKEQDFHRARLLVAAVQLESDRTDAARSSVDEVLARSEEHDRASRWSERLTLLGSSEGRAEPAPGDSEPDSASLNSELANAEPDEVDKPRKKKKPRRKKRVKRKKR